MRDVQPLGNGLDQSVDCRKEEKNGGDQSDAGYKAADVLRRVGHSVLEQPESQPPPSTLGDGEGDPELEEGIDKGFLVLAHIDGTETDCLDHGLGGGPITFGS